ETSSRRSYRHQISLLFLDTRFSAVSPNLNVPSSHASSTGDDKKDVYVMEHYAPKYNPERWNKYELIRTNNNCYNYANQKITNGCSQDH
ncbi:unnamed protein product, partial [Pocillopora meandrina]